MGGMRQPITQAACWTRSEACYVTKSEVEELQLLPGITAAHFVKVISFGGEDGLFAYTGTPEQLADAIAALAAAKQFAGVNE
jgi:alkanesulfonate monooxygenase SsuD/methylene tetrahydromethanopterin reductase-like flavin-dependent oxidoreductase (luciferase family)